MTKPNTKEFIQIFTRIGFLSFGGPAAQISLMQSELVDRHKWLSHDAFLRALSFCMLLPGPEAMQLATFAGWRLKGIWGGMVAGLLFFVPGAILILGLALLYIYFGSVGFIQDAFTGVQAAVIVIVIGALIKISQKALKGMRDYALACAAFVGLFFLGAPFPVVIGLAAFVGLITAGTTGTQMDEPTETQTIPWRTLAVLSVLWILPIAVSAVLGHDFLTQVGLFFSKLAVVTFGGAYAVLSYMTQSMVQDYGWITTEQMVTALGLAETTPGPLILVTEFVAILAGFEQGGLGLAILAGMLSLWVTFIPCFIWIFAGGPLLDRLTQNPRIAAALSAITAAVVGVIFNLSLWFSFHVFFKTVNVVKIGPIDLNIPDPSSLNIALFGIFIAATYLNFGRKWSLFSVLGFTMGLAVVLGGLGVLR